MNIPIEYNQAFLTYLSLQGDIDKTAASLMCDEDELTEIATQHDWPGRYAKLQKIRADKGQEAMAKELNRTVNYVQAVQMRQLIDRVIIEIGDDVRLMDALSIPTKGGRTMFTTKPLEGLAKALETAQKMTYMALGDMITEREAVEERNAGSAALGVLRMMASRTGLVPERDEIMPAAILEEHLDQAEAGIAAAVDPVPPEGAAS